MTGDLPSREECIAAAGSVLAAGLAELDASTPREAAERAWRPGGPSVEQLESDIRASRGLDQA